MNVSVPTSMEDITIGQYQEAVKFFDTNPNDHDLVNGFLRIFLGIHNGDDLKQKDRELLYLDIVEALNNNGAYDNQPFLLNNEMYAILPNLDKLTGSEWRTITMFNEFEESKFRRVNFKADTLHMLMAVFFRPVEIKRGTRYRVKSYSGSIEEAEKLKNLPMSRVLGFEGFFLTLRQELENLIQMSTQEGQAKEVEH